MSQHAAWIADLDKARLIWLLAELVSLREAIMGSMPLVILIESGCPPEGLSAALFEGQIAGREAVFDSINDMVTQLAIGDALMRSRETLMPRRPMQEAVGMFMHSIPNWKQLYEFVDASAEEAFKGDPGWSDKFSNKGYTWRARFNAALKELPMRFGEC